MPRDIEGTKAAARMFADKVQAFGEAASEVLRAWEKLGPGLEADDLVVKTYPFDKDFMELVMDIYGWRDSVKGLEKVAK